MKNDKGITLIALVITIIVMLILVAVTITIAVNGGLFNYAKEAGVKTNGAKDAEQEYANLGDYEDHGFSTDYEYLIDKYAVKEIHFTILNMEEVDEEWVLQPIQCTAEEGMTWRDWYQSNYPEKTNKINKEDFSLAEGEGDEEGKVWLYLFDYGLALEGNTDADLIDTEIINGATYYLV